MYFRPSLLLKHNHTMTAAAISRTSQHRYRGLASVPDGHIRENAIQDEDIRMLARFFTAKHVTPNVSSNSNLSNLI
jgi:hypothetical protein